MSGGLSLSIRINEAPTPSVIYPRVTKAEDVAAVLKPIVRAGRELFLIVHLNSKNDILDIEAHTIGDSSGASVFLREVFRSLLHRGSDRFICVHNHPSGDPGPSPADSEITRTVYDGAQVLGLDFLDHIILGKNGYYSFAEQGLMPTTWRTRSNQIRQ